MDIIETLNNHLQEISTKKRRCPRCGETKDSDKDFHKGTSMCRECRAAYDQERKQRANPRDPAIDILLETVTKMAKRMEIMERTMKAHGWKLGEDDEEKDETPLKPSKSKSKPVDKSSDDDDRSNEDTVPAKPKKIVNDVTKKTGRKIIKGDSVKDSSDIDVRKLFGKSDKGKNTKEESSNEKSRLIKSKSRK